MKQSSRISGENNGVIKTDKETSEARHGDDFGNTGGENNAVNSAPAKSWDGSWPSGSLLTSSGLLLFFFCVY